MNFLNKDYLIRNVSLFLIPPLLASFIFNLFLGYKGIPFELFYLPGYLFPGIYILSIALIVIFEKFRGWKKFGLIFLLIVLDLAYREGLILYFGDSMWGMLILMIMGTLEVATLVLSVGLFSIFASFEPPKRQRVVWIVLGILVLLNAVQFLGLIRPGFIE